MWAYHELLGQDEHTGTPASQPVHLSGPTLTGVGGEAVTSLELGRDYRLRHLVRFAAPVESPQVYFSVFDDSGEVVYQRVSVVGQRYRSYAAGEETEVDILFTARMGVGRYRMAAEIRSLDGRTVLGRSDGDLTIDRVGQPTSRGSAELAASIVADGQGCAPLRLDRPPG